MNPPKLTKVKRFEVLIEDFCGQTLHDVIRALRIAAFDQSIDIDSIRIEDLGCGSEYMCAAVATITVPNANYVTELKAYEEWKKKEEESRNIQLLRRKAKLEQELASIQQTLEKAR